MEPPKDCGRRAAKAKSTLWLFCEKTSLHGWSYVSEPLGLVHRLGWVAVVAFFGIVCASLVFDTVQDFSEDKVLSTLDTITYPVEKVQYPTLTICPPEYVAPDEYDEWWFIRAAFNQFQFFCDTPAACERSKTLREDYSEFLSEAAKRVLELTPMPDDRRLRATVFEGVTKRAAATGNSTEVYVAVMAKVYERLTGKLDDGLLAYLGINLESNAPAYKNLNGAELIDCLDMRSTVSKFMPCMTAHGLLSGAFESCVNASDDFTRNEKHVIASCLSVSADTGIKEVEECAGKSTTSNAFLKCIDSTASGEGRMELIRVVDAAARALAYPLAVGFGDLVSNLHSLVATDDASINRLLSSLRQKILPALNLSESCQKLYPIYATGGSAKSYTLTNHEGSERLSDIALCYQLFRESRPGIIARLRHMLRSANYPLRDAGTFSGLEDPTYCQFPVTNELCKFLPVPTDRDRCVAFNAAPLTTSYASEPFVRVWHTAHDINDSDFTVVRSKPDLTANRMTMIFDRTQWALGDNNAKNNLRFAVDINAMLDYFDVSTNGGVEARVGYETVVTVEPVEAVSFDSMKTLTAKERSCRYGDEIDEGSLFKVFTQKSCFFEAKFNYALKRHGCTPWFMPHDKLAAGGICSQEESVRFRQTMEAYRLNASHKQCAENCNDVDFDVFVTSNPIDASEACDADSTGLLGLGRGAKWRSYEEQQLQWRLDNYAGVSFCEHKVRNDLAFVTVKIRKTKMMRIVRRRRVSFTGMLGSLGNYYVLTT